MVETHFHRKPNSNPTSEMPMEVQMYPEGLDCVWIALDREGIVGCFITAGEGPIPQGAFSQNYVRLEDVECQIMALPKLGRAELRAKVPRPEGFLELAERGFHVYDWADASKRLGDCTGSYELVATPPGDSVMRDAALPSKLKALARCVRLEGERFGVASIRIV